MDFLLVHGSTQSPHGYDRLAGRWSGAATGPWRWTSLSTVRSGRRPGTRLWSPGTVFDETAATPDLPPSTYVLPTADRTLTPDWMRRAARERLGTDPVEVPGGHCPPVSRPEQVAAILDR